MNINSKKYLPVVIFVLMIGIGFILYNGNSPEGARKPTLSNGVENFQVSTSMDYIWMILKMLLILGGICGLAWLSLKWILPRMYGPGSNLKNSNRIELIESYRLDPRRSLFLVRVGKRLLLLSGSEGGINLLADLGEEVDEITLEKNHVELPKTEASQFEKLLRGKE